MIRHRALDTLSEYCNEDAVEQAVQAIQPITASDAGLPEAEAQDEVLLHPLQASSRASSSPSDRNIRVLGTLSQLHATLLHSHLNQQSAVQPPFPSGFTFSRSFPGY